MLIRAHCMGNRRTGVKYSDACAKLVKRARDPPAIFHVSPVLAVACALIRALSVVRRDRRAAQRGFVWRVALAGATSAEAEPYSPE